MNDYDRIALIIRHLDAHHTLQPSLDEMAGWIGLSPHHFHRLFVRWAGVTPKTFLQCLTLSDAKQRLLAGNSVLSAAIETGLSGPSRLHDLCVQLESASPGEIKSGGEGWTIQAGLAESPLGRCLVANSPRGICHFSFADSSSYEEAENTLRGDWPRAEFQWNDRVATGVVDQAFAYSGDDQPIRAPLKCLVHGTKFQLSVWRALVQIPHGHLVSYSAVAKAIGNAKASRAVGSAVGSNAIGVLIPCHRVIRETAVIGNYRWGTVRKRALLARESAVYGPPSETPTPLQSRAF